MEAGWLPRMQSCPPCTAEGASPAKVFRPHEVGGYWVADEPVKAVEQVVIDDLVGEQATPRDRAPGRTVHLAVLAAGYELDRRVQRLPSGQQHPAPGPVRVDRHR